MPISTSGVIVMGDYDLIGQVPVSMSSLLLLAAQNHCPYRPTNRLTNTHSLSSSLLHSTSVSVSGTTRFIELHNTQTQQGRNYWGSSRRTGRQRNKSSSRNILCLVIVTSGWYYFISITPSFNSLNSTRIYICDNRNRTKNLLSPLLSPFEITANRAVVVVHRRHIDRLDLWIATQSHRVEGRLSSLSILLWWW